MRNPNVTCDVCGKSFYKRPSELEKSNGRAYCSKSCFGVSCRKPVSCVVCGSEILASLNKKTCSKECSAVWNKSVNRAHSRGRRKVDKPKWGTRSFRTKFMDERGTSCEVCGYGVVEVLVIHHVVERSKGGSDDYSNLMLICPNCHGEIHRLGKFLGRLTSQGAGPPC